MIKHFVVLCLTALCLLLSSCRDEFTTNPAYTVGFSVDTLSFDTVFTTVGSATRTIMVYNHNKYQLRLDEVKLEQGANSPFRINVSGQANVENRFTNIEMRSKDSMYVFVEVTVDPSSQNTPLRIEDKFCISVNGRQESVVLQAYGQDVIIFRNHTFQENNTILTDEKPYLIYGDLVVDTLKTLTVTPGAKLYFHNGANLKVKGNLIAKGSLQQPIVFRGDRFDRMSEGTPYEDMPLQWGGIQLTGCDAAHELEYMDIQGGTTALSLPIEKTQLYIRYSRIHNFGKNGIDAKNAIVTIENSEISNCGEYCLAFAGGNYTVVQSTIANYYWYASRTSSSVALRNYTWQDENQIAGPINANFTNCIIYGASDTELFFDKADDENISMTCLFKNCLLKMQEKDRPESGSEYFKDVIWNSAKEDVFESTKRKFDFRLHENSPAIGKADVSVAEQYPTDLNGNSRIGDSQADIGAYKKTPDN